MKLPNPKIDLPAILRAIDDEVISLTPLPSCSSCEVWRIAARQRDYALRIFSKRPIRCGIRADFHIRNMLVREGVAVARPVTNSERLPEVRSETDWVLDEFVSGTFCNRGEIYRTVCADLGRTLAALHQFPAAGYGVPAIENSDVFQGTSRIPLAGLESRFQKPLPIEEHDLTVHPVFQFDPGLAYRLRPAIHSIHKQIRDSEGVVCHSDLHERQLICRENRLAALIDFGDATIADARWDFASLLYFHGPIILADTLLGYTQDDSKRRHLTDGAFLFSVGIAMHHAARSQLSGKEHRLPIAMGHLRRMLQHPACPARIAG